jgi:hypothetical protein
MKPKRIPDHARRKNTRSEVFDPFSILRALLLGIVARRRKFSFIYTMLALFLFGVCYVRVVSHKKSLVKLNKKRVVVESKLRGRGRERKKEKFYNEHLQQITMKFDYSTFLPHILR